MFSCGFCEIFKNTFFTEHFCTNASDVCNLAKECTPPKLFLILSKSVRPLKVVIWSWQPPDVSCKKTCSQNSQENTCVRVSFLIKLQACGLWPATLLKKRLRYRCFPLNFAEFLRIPFLQNISGWLLLSWLYWKKSVNIKGIALTDKQISAFHATVLSLYPLKISEN